jgi:uncharacterized RDD family membrane protein YckC
VKPFDATSEGQSSLYHRRIGAFLVDYLLLLAVPAMTLVLAVYIKRHWPIVHFEEVIAVPGFLAVGATILYDYVISRQAAAWITYLITVTGAILSLVAILYNWVYVYGKGRQSFGKTFFGLRVARLDQENLGYWGAIQRHLIGYPLVLSSLGIGLIGLLRPVNGEAGRGWHDRVAGTYVEDETPARGREQ